MQCVIRKRKMIYTQDGVYVSNVLELTLLAETNMLATAPVWPSKVWWGSGVCGSYARIKPSKHPV